MKLGLVFPQTEMPDDPVAIRDFAQTAEKEGFDYLLTYDHVLGVDSKLRPDWDPFKVFENSNVLPVDSDTPRAPYDYQSSFQEPLVLYSYLAAVTERIEMATGIVISHSDRRHSLRSRQRTLQISVAVAFDLASALVGMMLNTTRWV